MAEIVIEITEDGQIKGDIEGIHGPDCEGLLDFLKDLGEVTDEGRTRDYYRQSRRQQRGRERAKR
jgi:hypothetical protein